VVAHFVRLRLTLLGNTLRRSVWQTIGLVVAALYALSIVLLLVGAAVVGGTEDPVVTGQVLVVGGAALVLGWWVLPLFAFGVDATLDPWRFTTFAVPRRRLLLGLAAAGLVSVPAAATLLIGLGTAFAWASDPLALLAALVGAVAALAVCVVGSRATTTTLAPLLDSRRRREVLMIAAVVPLLAIGPFFAWLSSLGADGSTVTVTVGGDGALAALEPVARFLAWTPFGAPWALGSAVHEGAWGRVAALVAIVVATLVALALLWDRAMARALVAPRGGSEASKGRGLGWFGRVPAGPTAAVAARCATYWLRDPRYSASLALVPLVPVVVVAVGMSSGAGGGIALWAAPFAAFILGFSLSNDVGYDNTAFALHVASGTPGRADRWGRVIPVAAIGVPLVAAMTLAAVWATGRWADLPAVLGLSLGVLGTALGVSSAVSARLVYPVPKPGESAFRSPQGAAVATIVAQTLAFVVVLALLVPTLALTVAALLLPSLALGWAALVVGPAWAVVVLVLGVRWGARTYERRLPDLLAQVTAFA
jgi:ABC-2 type transport system permease protein